MIDTTDPRSLIRGAEQALRTRQTNLAGLYMGKALQQLEAEAQPSAPFSMPQ